MSGQAQSSGKHRLLSLGWIVWEATPSLSPWLHSPCHPYHLLSPQRLQLTPKVTPRPEQLVAWHKSLQFGIVKVEKEKDKNC